MWQLRTSFWYWKLWLILKTENLTETGCTKKYTETSQKLKRDWLSILYLFQVICEMCECLPSAGCGRTSSCRRRRIIYFVLCRRHPCGLRGLLNPAGGKPLECLYCARRRCRRGGGGTDPGLDLVAAQRARVVAAVRVQLLGVRLGQRLLRRLDAHAPLAAAARALLQGVLARFVRVQVLAATEDTSISDLKGPS